WNAPTPGSDNFGDCWFVMNIYSPSTTRSSILLASGLRSGGIFETRSSQGVWNVIEDQWHEINNLFRVPRFHAAHLNCKQHEYEGWDDNEKIRYSKKLLRVVNEQGKQIRPISCGMLANEYRAIISEKGQRNLGPPYLACFKACIAHIARDMREHFPSEDKLEVLLDTDTGYLEAIDTFHRMKIDTTFPYRDKLATIVAGSSEDTVPLQVADMVAYEVFKRLHILKTTEDKMRTVLESLYSHNRVIERYFSAQTFRNMKESIENAKCRPGGLVICPTN
ncbi:MAG TPA: DUF3800 domain-containing protein, partial [Silvibacterium sp.]|nr:DUF3800 domain-containing protein [Silvibacterium sp.]